jgi:hypothetical protein
MSCKFNSSFEKKPYLEMLSKLCSNSRSCLSIYSALPWRHHENRREIRNQGPGEEEPWSWTAILCSWIVPAS